MDVHMPVMNGADSGLEIKRLKPQARVVIMTGLDDWVADNAADLSAEGLLRKPFCPQALLDGPGIAAAVICGVGCRKSVAATALDLCQ
jgi:CheY-like chemotaxis protein